MQEDHHFVVTEDLWVLGTGVVVALVGMLGGRGMVILGHIIFARILGAGAFGLFSIDWTLLSLVVLDLVRISYFGINGAALVSAFVTAGMYIGGQILVKKSTGMWPYDRKYAKVVAAGAVVMGLFAV